MSTESIAIDKIIVDERQRKVSGDVETLRISMHERGLLQCIGVQLLNDSGNGDTKYRLLWGGRRLAAAKELQWEHIEAKVAPSMEDYEASELEFLENWERKSLSWQEECQAIGLIHAQRMRANALIGEAWGQRETGRLLGTSVGNVNYTLKIAQLLSVGDKEVFQASSMAEALRIVARRKEAEAASQGQQPPPIPTFFNPNDFQSTGVVPATSPISKREYVLHRYVPEITTGIVGHFYIPGTTAWILSKDPVEDIFEGAYSWNYLAFRNTSVNSGRPFIPCLEIFNFYWRDEIICHTHNIIPIYTDNPSLDRVLFGPGAMTDGWWQYIFEAVGRGPVFFYHTPLDGIYYCLRHGIETYAELSDEDVEKLVRKMQPYGPLKIETT